jgi:hypothetical protein
MGIVIILISLYLSGEWFFRVVCAYLKVLIEIWAMKSLEPKSGLMPRFINR